MPPRRYVVADDATAARIAAETEAYWQAEERQPQMSQEDTSPEARRAELHFQTQNDPMVMPVAKEADQILWNNGGKLIPSLIDGVKSRAPEIMLMAAGVAGVAKGGGAAEEIRVPEMKDSDFGPKIGDPVPTNGVPGNWTKDQIADAITDYETSIASRKAEQAAFDAAGTGSATERLAHARRITEEESFLKSLLKAQENRR